jgi:hypothetical protein
MFVYNWLDCFFYREPVVVPGEGVVEHVEMVVQEVVGVTNGYKLHIDYDWSLLFDIYLWQLDIFNLRVNFRQVKFILNDFDSKFSRNMYQKV